jgi:hypothetical protein
MAQRNDGAGERNAVRDIIDLAENNRGSDTGGYREDFVALLYEMRSME